MATDDDETTPAPPPTDPAEENRGTLDEPRPDAEGGDDQSDPVPDA